MRIGARAVERVNRVVAGSALEPFLRSGVLGMARVGIHVLPAHAERSIQFDAEIEDVMRRVLDSDSTVVDIGAHRGLYVRRAIRLAPRGAHVAVEPLPEMAALLRTRFPGVEVHEVAASDSEGDASFRHVLSAPAYSGFARRPYDTYEELVDLLTVRLARVDDIVGERHVRFLKIDVEGAGEAVLRGARRLLARERPYVAIDEGMPRGIWDELDRAGLKVSTPPGWLAGGPPLDFDQARAENAAGRWCFLAHPVG
jgi:FkbM family methyltransferase